MSVLPVCVVLLSYALVKGCEGAIQCYTCDDCRLVNDSLLQFCPSDAATVAVALTTTISPEELSTRGVPESTAAADVADPLTEAVVDDAGKEEEAEAGGAEAGEAEADGAETGEAEAGGAEAGGAETVEAEGGGAEAGEAEPAEAETGEAEAGVAEAGVAEADVAEAGGAEAGEAETGEADAAEGDAAEAEPEAAEGEDPEPQSASLVLSPDFISNLNITRRKRESTSNAVSYHCFSMERNDGGQMKTIKGCIAVPVNASACAILKKKHEASDKNCRICSQDKCNSGVVLKYSLAAALLVVVNSLLQW